MIVAAVDLGRDPAPSVETRSSRTVGWFGATALVPMVAAHVVGASAVNPVLDPISWYAFVPGGGELILAGAVTLAVLGLILTVRMYRAGLAVGPVPAFAMIAFAVAMVLVGAFPTDPPGTAVTFSATVHRISAAAAFCVLPLVGLSLERSIQRPRSSLPHGLRTAARALGIVVAVFLVVHLSLVFFANSGFVAFGLIERVGFVIMIGYLYLLAATIDQEGPVTEAEVLATAEHEIDVRLLVEPRAVAPAGHTAGHTAVRGTDDTGGMAPAGEPDLVLSGSRSADLVE